MTINFDTTRVYLQDFKFDRLFIEILGWAQPRTIRPITLQVADVAFSAAPIAQLAGVVVFEVSAADGLLPNAKVRAAVHKEISKLHHENLLIFLDAQRTQSLWYWVKREDRRSIPRDHLYVKGQPGDLFLGKLNAMFVDISELDEDGNINVLEVAQRLQKALDVQRVTKKFYTEFAAQRLQFMELIQGIPNDHDRRWYASVLLNRLMFIYFLQRKEFVDGGDINYLQNKLNQSTTRGPDRYYSEFLKALFFEGFAKPEEKRSDAVKRMLGRIRYLNGGLFLPHPIESKYGFSLLPLGGAGDGGIFIPDEAFANLLTLFASYSWNLNDTPGGEDNEINPDVLGYIFEKYINQKAFGAYYTRPEITEYLCEQTIYRLILQKVNTPGLPGVLTERNFEKMEDLLTHLDAPLCKQLLFEVLPTLSILDPACGSGAFLVAAMRTLINVYSAITGRIDYLNDKPLADWLKKTQAEHPSLGYFIKRSIITDNLFGVDIMEEASEIARLRLFLALVASVRTVDELEPLPNIDFNILPGNSLIGMLRVDEDAFNRKLAGEKQLSLFQQKSYRQIVDEKKRKLDTYRHTSSFTQDLQALRDDIQARRAEDYANLNDMLVDEFKALEIKYEQAIWDEKIQAEGKPKKRAVQLPDIVALQPFHWGYEFDEVMNIRGGFDVIITNPPWDIFKPNAKEFFTEYSDLVTKKKMTIKEFEEEQAKLLEQKDLREAWLAYESRFPYVNSYVRTAKQYANQIAIVAGKKAGTDINLYRLFVEQCFNLLKPHGLSGMVIPSGIYTDLGTKQLREMLFSQSQITGLFCFENRKEVFEGVHRSFKFVVLTFEKGHQTEKFPATFMRHDVQELIDFPNQDALFISVPMIRRLSPDSLSIMEFKNIHDVEISEKMLIYPLLGEETQPRLVLELHREFHMTDDAPLFQTQPSENSFPLYEGKMIFQFTHSFAEPRFWVKAGAGRKALLRKNEDYGQKLGYQKFRLAYRTIASNTNERTLICTVIPPCFTGNSLNISESLIGADLFSCVALLNSFVIDWYLRNKVSANINQFFIYQLPIPRLSAKHPSIVPIVQRAAQLICTTPEFDELASEVGLGSHKNGVTDPQARARLRAELDGMIAHLYGLSESEFAHILSTFPIVKQEVKDAALEAYRGLAPNPALRMMIQAGETEKVEFKLGAFRNPRNGAKDDGMMLNVLQEVVAFMNSGGGTVLVGVEDDATVQGIEIEYAVANSQKQNWDGYQLNLIDSLKRLSILNASRYYQVEKHNLNGKDICQLTVQPAPEPVYIDRKFFVREGNRKRELSVQEGHDYISRHWHQ